MSRAQVLHDAIRYCRSTIHSAEGYHAMHERLAKEAKTIERREKHEREMEWYRVRIAERRKLIAGHEAELATLSPIAA